MPLLGAHLSIAGGYHKALEAAAELGMETVQLFTKNNNQWRAKPITEEESQKFKARLKETGLKFPTAHTSYLINIASPDEELFAKSLEALVVEIQRADQLGLKFLVLHPGAHMGSGEEAGLARVAQALDMAHQRCPEAKVKILLETTAGQGTSLGHRFDQLGAILTQVQSPKRLGVCLDTCHVFAAGYPLTPVKAYRATLEEFDRLIGLGKLLCFHLNDSKKPLGSRVDRHDHIGRGHLGPEPFQHLLNDPRFVGHPMILETPKEEGEEDTMDRVNLATLRALIKARGR